MNFVRLMAMMLAGSAPLQTLSPPLTTQPAQPATPSPSPLAADTELHEALDQARATHLPHRMLLADHIESLIEDKKFNDRQAFKNGALAVLRHSDFSDDLVLGELYLRMLQQPVIDDLVDALNAARTISIDGKTKDWPKGSLVDIPKSSSRPRGGAVRSDSLLKRFGALRGQQSLFVTFETYKKIDPDKLAFELHIAKLADRFAEPAYKVRLARKQISFFDRDGSEIKINEQDEVYFKFGPRVLEMRIPLTRFESDLRSIAVCGSAADHLQKRGSAHTPWVSCPTGPTTEPTEMLIHFAGERGLPQGNGLPIAIALQEGLLLGGADDDLANKIKADALAWLKLALDIDEQVQALGFEPASRLPAAVQLAWACRYDGQRAVHSLEEYEFAVPSPGTLADLRGYAGVQGWLSGSSYEVLRDQISTMMVRELKAFDFPNASARGQGPDYQDSREDAYIVKGGEKFLSYRDVGVNRRWKFFEEGFGLKGSLAQGSQFQRLLSMAIGLPTLQVAHRGGVSDAAYTISYDSRKRRWFAVGATAASGAAKSKITLLWRKPWTRPERFALDIAGGQLPAKGPARFLVDVDGLELSVRRLSSMLEKGLSDEMLSDSIMVPLRMRQ